MISGDLNTAVQVQSMSLGDLKSSFNWIKEEIGSLEDRIAWAENESGKYIDARDLVAIMCLLNPILFPNDKSLQPIVAYTSKEKSLELFKKDNAAAFTPMTR